jgi:hypothetical protein
MGVQSIFGLFLQLNWKETTFVTSWKNICLFTVTRPTLFSAATLFHFIDKSKVKVDTSEIFGLKKLFPVTSWKIIGINFLRVSNRKFLSLVLEEQAHLRPKKNICLFTVTRPTLFSAATLVHFIGKSKVNFIFSFYFTYGNSRLRTYPYPEKVPDFRIYLIALRSEGVIIPQKNCCSRFTVTRPTLFSAATLVHFIGKSKVKVDTSETFGLKKLFPVTSWKIIGIIFLLYDRHYSD